MIYDPYHDMEGAWARDDEMRVYWCEVSKITDHNGQVEAHQVDRVLQQFGEDIFEDLPLVSTCYRTIQEMGEIGKRNIVWTPLTPGIFITRGSRGGWRGGRGTPSRSIVVTFDSESTDEDYVPDSEDSSNEAPLEDEDFDDIGVPDEVPNIPEGPFVVPQPPHSDEVMRQLDLDWQPGDPRKFCLFVFA